MGYRGNIPRFYAFVALTEALLWMPVWVVFFARRGLSLSQIGVLELVTMLLLAAAEVPTGAVADTWGRKASLALGATLHGLALLGLLAGVLSGGGQGVKWEPWPFARELNKGGAPVRSDLLAWP